jgi:predicted nucleic acid-binding protein
LKEVILDAKTIAKAKEIITNSSHPKSGFPSFYDVSYHALAIVNECQFITADKKHYEKTKKEGYIELI